MMIQVAAMIGANVYQASDKPRYHKANRGMIALLAFNLVIMCKPHALGPVRHTALQ
jgi:hypothetical protein